MVESAVLAQVSTGATNQQIASTLFLSSKTVTNHLYRIYRKLSIASSV